MDTQEIQFIVERLNEPPFSMGLSLVMFDEKTPFELLEIVNLLMAQLSAEHRIDLRDETPEATANRMLDFLRVLNYKLVHLPSCTPPSPPKPPSLTSLPHLLTPLFPSALSLLPRFSPLLLPRPLQAPSHALVNHQPSRIIPPADSHIAPLLP